MIQRVFACGALLTLVFVASVMPVSATQTARTDRRTFSGNVCATISAAALAVVDVHASCARTKTTVHNFRTPFGSGSLASYGARWGFGTPPDHGVSIAITKALGSPALVSYYRKRYRANVLANGQPASVGSLGSIRGETFSCVNPSTEDCTEVKILAIVRNYVIAIVLDDYPAQTTTPVPEPDVASDLVQEETLFKPLIEIGRAVAAQLP